MNSANDNSIWIDGSLFPDCEAPGALTTLNERIDFISRLCSAWDFGVLPLPETLAEVRKSEWMEAVEETNLLTSCAYHLLRDFHGLEPLPYLGPKPNDILNDPCLEFI
ncbi:MAG: hypothetical protein ACOY90_09040 [Candidatus Zhuqueibacterota bacterium]